MHWFSVGDGKIVGYCCVCIWECICEFVYYGVYDGVYDGVVYDGVVYDGVVYHGVYLLVLVHVGEHNW